MHAREFSDSLNRFLQSSSNLALCFFFLSVIVLAASGFGTWALVSASRFEPTVTDFMFPPAFAVSTMLLAAGSWTLHRANSFVRIERQIAFRRNLWSALAAGTMFVSVQSYGLWCLLSQKQAAATLGLHDGAFAFTLMHGVHFLVALLFVVFVLLRALADRYDHEYFWGVTFCTWFWHALGIAWLVIMAAFLVAGSAVVPRPA